MSLRKNVLATYASQAYVMIVTIVFLPLYVRYMGTEAFGLVGFFTMLLVWFQLLDLGLTATMVRESARFRGGVTGALALWQLLRSLELVFVAVAAAGGCLIAGAADFIATRWLLVETLPLDAVRDSVVLMGVIVALRWVGGLYRSVIAGFERLVWLGGLNMLVATMRFAVVIPYFVVVGTSPVEFFVFQLCIAVIELALLGLVAYRLMPPIHPRQGVRWRWSPLRNVLRFTMGVAFTSSMWVFITQTDKLILSKLLTLGEYAYFTFAVLAAGGVLVIGGPISSALLPRLTRLQAQGDEATLVGLYRQATQLVAMMAVPAALVLTFFSEEILWAWTGDANIALEAAPILELYALGNGILAVSAFPYYLQFAKGDLRLHLIGSALFVLMLVPGLVWATWRYGALGAGYAWLAVNSMYFAIWAATVHARYLKGLHASWLMRDVAPIVVMATLACAAAAAALDAEGDRLAAVARVVAASCITFAAAGLGSSSLRAKLRKRGHAIDPTNAPQVEDDR